VLSQSLATQRREVVDSNQELVALGAANLAAGLFHGFPISASASRTPVAVSAGARSQLTPLVGATAIVVLLVVAPGALRNLPQPILAAVVITAAIGLVDARAVGRLSRVRRPEFVLWLAAFLGVALLGSWSASWWRSCCRWVTSCVEPGDRTTRCSAARTS
jgi:MFS superfamily sulfate permease-like transporter